MRSRAAILYEYGRPWTVEEFELNPPRAGEVLLQQHGASHRRTLTRRTPAALHRRRRMI
jgi:Zn-dependent alcohol dehydrogenase